LRHLPVGQYPRHAIDSPGASKIPPAKTARRGTEKQPKWFY